LPGVWFFVYTNPSRGDRSAHRVSYIFSFCVTVHGPPVHNANGFGPLLVVGAGFTSHLIPTVTVSFGDALYVSCRYALKLLYVG